MHALATGVMFYRNFRRVSAIGWSACKAKVYAAQISYSLVSDRRLEIFSRYSSVETAEGSEVKLDTYLEKVWEVVGRSALAQVLGTAESQGT